MRQWSTAFFIFALGVSVISRAQNTATVSGVVFAVAGGDLHEFSQFARMPSPRAVPSDLRQLVLDTLALYNGIFSDVRLTHRLADDVPLVRLDPEQIRRVLINLVDNASSKAR